MSGMKGRTEVGAALLAAWLAACACRPDETLSLIHI